MLSFCLQSLSSDLSVILTILIWSFLNLASNPGFQSQHHFLVFYNQKFSIITQSFALVLDDYETLFPSRIARSFFIDWFKCLLVTVARGHGEWHIHIHLVSKHLASKHIALSSDQSFRFWRDRKLKLQAALFLFCVNCSFVSKNQCLATFAVLFLFISIQLWF